LNSERGLLIVFEGLDQSGKQTQAERLRDRLVASGRTVRLLSFPDYDTPIGTEIGRALRGERDYSPEVMQLLYVANRYEFKEHLLRDLGAGVTVVCDRYLASSVAYGEAQGLDASWLMTIQQFLPQPDVTFLLDIVPEIAARRKTADRDRYERDLAMLARVRDSYHRLARRGWVTLDAGQSKEQVATQVARVIDDRMSVR
jgi:dTMP kinase